MAVWSSLELNLRKLQLYLAANQLYKQINYGQLGQFASAFMDHYSKFIYEQRYYPFKGGINIK